MATAQKASQAKRGVFDEIGELTKRAAEISEQKRQLMSELESLEQERSETLKRIADVATSASESMDDSVEATTNSTVLKPKRGRPSEKDKQTQTKGDGRGRRALGKGGMPLKRVIWDILSRQPSSWRNDIPDLPPKVTGLKVDEIRMIIEKEGTWSSTSATAGQQVQHNLYALKNDGKVFRSDDRRYSIVDGAEYDGPKLDEDGNPVE